MASCLGTLDELRPRSAMLPSIIVTPFVAVVRADVAIEMSDEVASTFWVPLASLADPLTAVESEVTARGSTWRVPSYQLGGHTVWGMTERILRNLLRAAGMRLIGALARDRRRLPESQWRAYVRVT